MPVPQPLPALKKALKKALGSERDQLKPDARPVVVLGVGSELRSDDAVGLRVASAIADLHLPNVFAIQGGPAPENSTGEIRALAPSHLIIVDAADMRAEPGSVRVLDPDDLTGSSFATHGLPLSVLSRYLRDEIGCRITFIGVQPASVAFGEILSPPAEEAARILVMALSECLAPDAAPRDGDAPCGGEAQRA